MKISYIFKKVCYIMSILEDIDFINLDKRKYNQEQINKAYNVLDSFKDEIIRENIKNKQKREENE